jgi:hypothetical protein
MPQAIIDPEQVRRFAEELQRFNRDLQGRMTSLHARFLALSETWQDQEQAKFAEEFQEAMSSMKRLLAASELHVPHLLRKAQRAEEYLKQK